MMHAERMRYIRVDLLGISQREMAGRMNAIQPGLRMSPTSISRYERGDIKPSLGTQEVYKRLEAQALNVPGQHPTGMTAPLAINFIRRLGYSEVRSMLSAATPCATCQGTGRDQSQPVNLLRVVSDF